MPKINFKNIQPQDFISVTKAAQFLKVSADTLRNWEKSGKLIPSRTIGGARRYNLSQLVALKKELHPVERKRIGLLTVSKVAKVLGVSSDTIRSWDKKNVIESQRTEGGARRFTKVEVNRLVKELNLSSSSPIAYERQETITPVQFILPEGHKRDYPYFFFKIFSGVAIMLLISLIGIYSLFIESVDQQRKDLLDNLKNLSNKNVRLQLQVYKLAGSLESLQKSVFNLQATKDNKNQVLGASTDNNISSRQGKTIILPNDLSGLSLPAESLKSGTIPSDRLSGEYPNITGVGTITLGTWEADVIDEAHGGTNQDSYGKGDILYSSENNKLSKLPIGGEGQILTVNSGLPRWSNPPSPNCQNCLNNSPASTQVITPSSGSVTGLSVASAPSATADVFNITDNSGQNKFFLINNSGNAIFNGTVALKDILYVNKIDGGASKVEFNNGTWSLKDSAKVISNIKIADQTPWKITDQITATNQGQNELAGISIEPTFVSGADNKIFKAVSIDPSIYPTNSPVSTSSGTLVGLDIKITDNGTSANNDLGLNVDVSTGVKNGAATKIAAVFQGGNVGIGVTNPSHQLQLSTDDAVKPGSGTWSTISDERTKRDITDFTDGLNVIRQIKPINFTYNGLGGTISGLKGISIIAQDVKPIAPYLIGSYKAKLNPTDSQETDILSFNPHGLFFVTINAIKELDGKISDLNSQISLNSNLKLDSAGSLIVPKGKFESLDLSGVRQVNLLSDDSSLDSNSFIQTGSPASTTSPNQDLASTINNLSANQNLIESQVGQIKEKVNLTDSRIASNSAGLASLKQELEKTQKSIQNSKIKPDSDLESTPTLDNLPIASSSATLAKIDVSQGLTLSSLKVNDATVSGTLKSLGESYLGKTVIAGDLSLDGAFSISSNTNGTQINSLPNLFIQTSDLAQKVDFFNGGVTIDKLGNLQAQSILVAEYKVQADKTSGSGKILAKSQSVEIENPLVSDQTRILITPTSQTDQVLAVTAKEKAKKFTVSTPEAAKTDISFDWWLIEEVKKE